MARINKVLIVGGGIAGLTLAIGLTQQGIEVDLVEIKTEWTVYGVGIIQQANVLRAMEHLGLLDTYVATGFPFDEVGMYGPDGGLRVKLPSPRLAGNRYPANMGISRRALHDMLTHTAQEKGTRVRLGITVHSFEEGPDHIEVTFTDGTQGQYDLVVGADGLYSKVRTLLFGDIKPTFSGMSVWRHNFQRPAHVDHLMAYPSTPHTNAAGIVPLGKDLMYLFVTSREDGNPWMPQEKLHQLMQERMQGLGGLVGELAREITDPQQVVYKPIEVVFQDGPWHKGRVLLIGDAVHATSPHVGQGAGMAIEDSAVLSEMLPGSHHLEDTLQDFTRRRFERCRTIHQMSMQVNTWELTHPPDANTPGIIQQMMQYTAQPI
ncbi:FAD-dependent oxidoreductase [Deinococcus roseus]|uniref:FAD-dependent oxidoreductase n=1 Tax=Deinococcus roseus TaxID=392414 RepID=A0ABQ2DJJ4_9DEIO|nr:FAD-dependent oxidoreductase [Deinococcus roseus]GGJ58466.1 FAD-dependent oxidoreductase [Deinococcus roseus]